MPNYTTILSGPKFRDKPYLKVNHSDLDVCSRMNTSVPSRTLTSNEKQKYEKLYHF